jgi:tRNA(Ile)-lysidine synthase
MNRQDATWLGQIQNRIDGVRDGRVLVACSGGGDSTALLVFLWAIRKSLGLELVAAHLDHGLRPEAQADARFVQELCRRLDLDLVEARVDVQSHAQRGGLGLETAARELRWEWLRAEAASIGAMAVATGHTLDDHTETVFIRLARGGGLGTLTPLPARQGLRWSPLIEARREELRAYLQGRGLPWREDATNLEDFTPRNRWRKLLESIRGEAPALDRHLWETHAQAAELAEWRDAQVAQWRGSRWEILPQAFVMKGAFLEPELRWALEAAFRELDWPREAERLRDLAAWIHPLLDRKTFKAKTWGGWTLEAAQEPWRWILRRSPGRDQAGA